ncbi:acetate--CoA ligase family protein [Thermofilum pendens]|uniref:Acetyl-CoA synthetase n=1 Tax=Thermofilum pendens (strain DSM 2475 / Hrk 5) TaxID=368408 RepID=A1RWD9_THEPD|nr:acetate--CoA ligase family protein [Thermofilum pendens]ABL77519.1 conserved hypothetical protein [Thermofilum pendens Hrk 5]
MSVEEIFEKALSENRKNLSLGEAFAVCEYYGLPLLGYRFIGVDEEVPEALGLSYPVVVKVDSPDIVHKTEYGGVKTGIKSREELVKAIEDIKRSVKAKNPNARINGFIVQEQVSNAHEVIIGGLKDEQFGPVIAFGLGGVLVEILRDVAFDIAPITPQEARDLITRIKGYQILEGYRGIPKANIDALSEVLSKASRMFADIAKYVKEMDLNPTFVSSEWVKIADARFTLL